MVADLRLSTGCRGRDASGKFPSAKSSIVIPVDVKLRADPQQCFVTYTMHDPVHINNNGGEREECSHCTSST